MSKVTQLESQWWSWTRRRVLGPEFSRIELCQELWEWSPWHPSQAVVCHSPVPKRTGGTDLEMHPNLFSGRESELQTV